MKVRMTGFKLALMLTLTLALLVVGVSFGGSGSQSEPKASANEAQSFILYEEDFNDVTGRVDLMPGVNFTSNSADGWVYYAKSSVSSAYIQNGRMYFSGSAYDILYRDGAQVWGNYTLEADFCYASDNAGWGGMLYNVHEPRTFQKVGISLDGTASANGMVGGTWKNDSSTINKRKMVDAGLTVPTVNQAFRMKVITENRTSSFYYAFLDQSGNMTSDFIFIMSISNIPAGSMTGSIGFMTSNSKYASYWVDNIRCYSDTDVSFYENFNGYGDVTLVANATHADSGMKYIKNYSTGTAKIVDGRLEMNGGGNKYDGVLFTMGTDWTNYTVEADITYLDTPTGWLGLMYRSTDLKNFQKAGATLADRVALNGMRNGSWYKNTEGITLLNIKTDVTLNKAYKTRVEVHENSVKMYLAYYDENGDVGEWNYVLGHEDRFADIHLTGTVGFMVGGGTSTKTCHATVDNIIVRRGEDRRSQLPEPANVADIYQPVSGIVNPPVVAQSVSSQLPAKEGERPAVLFAEVDSSLNVLSGSGTVLTTAASFIDNYRSALIPAFIIDSEAEATALAALIEEKNLIDCYVVADWQNAGLVRSVRLANSVTLQTTGALIFDDLNGLENRKKALTLVADNMSFVAISRAAITQETAHYFNLRQIGAWGMVSSKADVYDAIACGYHGVIATDAGVVYDVYESITDVTVSGKPAIIAHRGANINVGYPENTMMGYRAAIEEYGADAVEVDVRISSDGYLYLMHDSSVDRTTNGTGAGGSMTLSQLKALTVDEVATKPTVVPTFEELLQFVKGTDIVVYCHINTKNDVNIASFTHLVDKYDCKENVIFFISYTSIGDYNSNTTTTASNAAYNLTNAPVVTGGMVYTAGDAAVLDGLSDHMSGVEAMRSNLNKYNYQALFYKYANSGNIWSMESFYYQMSARGFVNSHSITNGQQLMDELALTKSGCVGYLTDNIHLSDDYHYIVEAEDKQMTAGEKIDLTQTLTMITGSAEVECGLIQVAGDTLTAVGDSYTLNSSGSATVVYYATRTAHGGSTYTVYSQPVTLTFTQRTYELQAEVAKTCTTNGVKSHYVCTVNGEDRLYVMENGSYVEVTEDDLIIPMGHELEDVEGKPNTCTEDGYTAYKKCARCEYTEGKEVVPMGHSLEEVEGTPATESKEGVKAHFACSDCDKLFIEVDGVMTETTMQELTLAKLDSQDKSGCASGAGEIIALITMLCAGAFIFRKLR